MKTVLIDNEWLQVWLPKGFEPIEHQELEMLIGAKYTRMWGVRDTKRHMMVHVTWKDSSKFVSKFVNEKSLAMRVDKKFARCRPGSGYRNDGFFERSVEGADGPAQGFRFWYTVEDMGQEGEVMVFKRGIRCYTLNYYTRSQRAEANRHAYESIVSSLKVR